MDLPVQAALVLTISYLAGSVPFAYLIVKAVSGEDVTLHGSGNVGSMNVRRTTGSWGWFTVTMVADGMKGLIPVLIARIVTTGVGSAWWTPTGMLDASYGDPIGRWMLLVPQLAVAGAVIGHNYSCWMALIKHRFTRTGKGLATGGGALLAYDWRYFVAVVAVGLSVIAVTRIMMAGQVAAAATLPVTAWALHSSDTVFALLMGVVVYLAHHRRFVGLLRGQEPRLYINDRMGPRG